MPIRVLVVEDSLTVRRLLCDVIASDRELELGGEAADGRQALELCRDLRPDVITMDMMLPVMTGLAATEYIMAHQPTPIVIVSASVNRGELFRTYDALAAGAVDVLEKPRGDEPEGVWEARFLSTVKLVSRIRVITHPRARLGALGRTLPPHPAAALAPALHAPRMVAIGASTGGPGAVVEILRALPSRFQLPILLVMHINEPFAHALASWLDGQTPRPVGYPTDGEPVAAWAGRVAMAPPAHHMIVRDGRLRLTRDPERHSCRPSVDVLFESIARGHCPEAAACLLTGMGRDGASGLLAIRTAGGLTIAQDEATSVVYGMPREAAQLGAAERILPLPEIGPAIAALDGGRA
jgi:two-component system chemotaxis response regulator CheB